MSFTDLPSSTRNALTESKKYAEHFYGGRENPAGPPFILIFNKKQMSIVMLDSKDLEAVQSWARNANPKKGDTFTVGVLSKVQTTETPGDIEAIVHAKKTGAIKSISDIPGTELALIVEHQTPTQTTRAMYKYLGNDTFEDSPELLPATPNDGLAGISFYSN